MDIVIQGLTHIYMAGTPYERTALSGVNLKIPSGDILPWLEPPARENPP